MIEQWREPLSSHMRRRLGSVALGGRTSSSNRRRGERAGDKRLSAGRPGCKPESFVVMVYDISMQIYRCPAESWCYYVRLGGRWLIRLAVFDCAGRSAAPELRYIPTAT